MKTIKIRKGYRNDNPLLMYKLIIFYLANEVRFVFKGIR